MGPLEKILRQSPAWVDKATRAMYKRMLGNTSFENQELMQKIQQLIESGISLKDSRITALEKLQRPKGMQESNLVTAHMAGVQHMDPDAELLLAPASNDKAAASMIFRPSEHDDVHGIIPGSIYIEGLASEVPGGGTALLKELQKEYPGHAMHLESMSYPETLDFYRRKGFVEVPRVKGTNLIGGTAPFFIKPADVMIKKEGGGVKKTKPVAGGVPRRSEPLPLTVSPRDVEFGRLADEATAERAEALERHPMRIARRKANEAGIPQGTYVGPSANFVTPEQRAKDFEQRLEKGMIAVPTAGTVALTSGAWLGPAARMVIEGIKSPAAIAAMSGVGAGTEMLEDKPSALGALAKAAQWAAMTRMPISEALTYVPEAEAGTLGGVLSLLKGSKPAQRAAAQLFERAPGTAAFTDKAIADALITGNTFLPLSAKQFHNATFLMDDAIRGERGQLNGLREAIQAGNLQQLPFLEASSEALPKGKAWITRHDGRHRLQGISDVMGLDTKVPVLFDSSLDAASKGSLDIFPQSVYEEWQSSKPFRARIQNAEYAKRNTPQDRNLEVASSDLIFSLRSSAQAYQEPTASELINLVSNNGVMYAPAAVRDAAAKNLGFGGMSGMPTTGNALAAHKAEVLKLLKQGKAEGGVIKKAAKLAGGGLIKSAFDLAKAYPRITSEARLADYVASRLPSNLKSVGSLSRMASGTGRMPFALGDELVAKVARMPRGIMENSMEGDWVAPVPEAIWKSDDDAVSVVKRARPITAKQDPETMGLLNSLRTAIMNHGGRPDASPEMQEALDALGWDALLNYDPLWGDIAKRNIGVIENKPILLDAGILSKSILDPSAVSSTISPAEWAQYRREVLKSKNGYAKGGTVKPTYNTQNPMEHRSSTSQDRPLGAGWEDVKKGAKNWAPDVAGFFLGDIPDALAYVLRRAKNVQGEQSIPSLGAGAAVRRAVHDLQAELGLEDKFVPPTGQSVGPIYEPSAREEVAQFANPLAFVSPTSAARGAGRGGAEVIARAMQSEGPLARMATAGFRPVNVVKNKGGNWLADSVEDAMRGLKKAPIVPPEVLTKISRNTGLPVTTLQNMPPEAVRAYMSQFQATRGTVLDEPSVNNWIDKALTKYVKNQMATPEDPIRALAEQGVLHYEPPRNPSLIGAAQANRKDAGMRPQATTHLGGSWEDAADAALRPITAGQYQKQVGPNWEANPWMDKLAPEVPVYSVPRGIRELPNLGFNHLIDELSNAINPESGLPRHLLFPADRLDKVSVPQAVQRVSDINKWRAAMAKEAKKAAAEGIPVRKEYPDGYRWLDIPDTADVKANQFAVDCGLEGGWCTQSANTAKQYGSEEGRLHVLQGPDGSVHVQIHVAPGDQFASRDRLFDLPAEEYSKVSKRAEEILAQGEITDLNAAMTAATNEILGPPPQKITQIKGKQNRAPNPEYLPFVQDFVKSGQWSDVGDLQNTGLKRLADMGDEPMIQQAREKLGDYATPEEWDAIMGSTKSEGFAQGGSVPSKIETVGQLRAIIASLSKDATHA